MNAPVRLPLAVVAEQTGICRTAVIGAGSIESGIVIHRDHLLGHAKRRTPDLLASDYRPPARQMIEAAGLSGMHALVNTMRGEHAAGG